MCWQLSTVSPSPSAPFAPGSVYEVARPPRNGRDSNSSTSKPAPPSAAAADKPASPPPAMRTLAILMSVCHGRRQLEKVRRPSAFSRHDRNVGRRAGDSADGDDHLLHTRRGVGWDCEINL